MHNLLLESCFPVRLGRYEFPEDKCPICTFGRAMAMPSFRLCFPGLLRDETLSAMQGSSSPKDILVFKAHLYGSMPDLKMFPRNNQLPIETGPGSWRLFSARGEWRTYQTRVAEHSKQLGAFARILSPTPPVFFFTPPCWPLNKCNEGPQINTHTHTLFLFLAQKILRDPSA